MFDELPAILAGDEAIRDWGLWGHMTPERRANLERAQMIEIPISMIESDHLRAFALFLVAQAHPSWWEIPSSSSGKYHPNYENVVETVAEWSSLPMGGLMKHIYVVLTLALDDLRRHGIDPERPGTEADRIAELRDIVVFAAIIHDWAKNGDPNSRPGRQPWGQHTFRYHGEECAKILVEDQLPKFLELCSEVGDAAYLNKMVSEAAEAIADHYGVWSQAGRRPQAIAIDVAGIVDGIRVVDADSTGDKVEDRNAVAALLRQKVKPELSIVSVVLQEADYVSSRRYMNMPDPRAVKEFLYQVSPRRLHRTIKSSRSTTHD